jgi:hypothetical protein
VHDQENLAFIGFIPQKERSYVKNSAFGFFQQPINQVDWLNHGVCINCCFTMSAQSTGKLSTDKQKQILKDIEEGGG